MLFATACEGGSPRDLGASSALLTSTEPFQSDVSEFAGRWVGQANDVLDLTGNSPTYRFPSGSTEIVLDVAINEANDFRGPLVGNIRFGAGEPLTPPTDPDVGYPVGVAYDEVLSYDDQLLGVGFLGDRSLPPFEGADYPVESEGELFVSETGPTTTADGVLSFKFSTNQPLDAWCRLQTPYPYQAIPNYYSCVPETGGGFEVASPGTDAMCSMWGPPDLSQCAEDLSDIGYCFNEGEIVAQVNCDKLFLCSADYCICDEFGCESRVRNNRLTVRRVGDELVGVFQDTVFVNDRNLRVPLGEVHLRRAE